MVGKDGVVGTGIEGNTESSMGKKHRPGGQSVEGTLTEEISELSLEQNVHGCVILQLANTQACANLIPD